MKSKHALTALGLSFALCGLCVAQGQAITPDQALASVRTFTGDPTLEPEVEGFWEDPVLRGSTEWVYYHVRVNSGTHMGLYSVRGSDGVVFSMDRGADHSEGAEIPITTARTTAEAFARAHYPAFDDKQWYLEPEKYIRLGERYEFNWSEVLNAQGTHAPHYLTVSVDTVTGEVIGFARPPDRITGPTIPVITLAQAKSLAAVDAPLDPEVRPLEFLELRMGEDPVGVQGLAWHLSQTPAPTEDDPEPDAAAFISVDAIDGTVSMSYPLSSELSARNRRRVNLRKEAVKPTATIRQTGGAPLAFANPQFRDDHIWVRIEVFRAFGAKVGIDKAGFTASNAHVVSDNKQMRANYEQFGWWVPLRRAAKEMGWNVQWDVKKREVTIDAPSMHPDQVNKS